MPKPINRFDIQVVYPGVCAVRWVSRRDLPHTPISIAEALERYALHIREAVAAASAPAAPPTQEKP